MYVLRLDFLHLILSVSCNRPALVIAGAIIYGIRRYGRGRRQPDQRMHEDIKYLELGSMVARRSMRQRHEKATM